MRLVQRLKQACWWVGWSPEDSGAAACALVGMAGSWSLYCPWASGSSAYAWESGAGSWAFGGQGSVHRQLGVQGILKHSVCWWVVLCPLPTS